MSEKDREYLAAHRRAWRWVIEHHTSDGRSIYDGHFNVHAQTAVKWMAEFAMSERKANASSQTETPEKTRWPGYVKGDLEE